MRRSRLGLSGGTVGFGGSIRKCLTLRSQLVFDGSQALFEVFDRIEMDRTVDCDQCSPEGDVRPSLRAGWAERVTVGLFMCCPFQVVGLRPRRLIRRTSSHVRGVAVLPATRGRSVCSSGRERESQATIVLNSATAPPAHPRAARPANPMTAPPSAAPSP